MSGHVILFAKVPRLGAVKTRLAADTSAVFATRFARRAMAQAIRRLSTDPRWTCHLAVSPDHDCNLALPCWPKGRKGSPHRLAQGGGDLGARMASALRLPLRGPRLIVGCDIPGVTAGAIARALRALGRAEAVFGPAGDGGYWCIGWRGTRPLPPRALNGVLWGGDQALQQSIDSLPQRCRITLVDLLEDVDNLADHTSVTAPLRPRWPSWQG